MGKLGFLHLLFIYIKGLESSQHTSILANRLLRGVVMPILPKLNPAVVDAITDMLVSEQGMLRPPDKAAALMALIVELHEQGQPFPHRKEVAEHIDASLSTVDAALSTRLDEGYITQRVETRRGNVQRRNSIVRERFYTPSQHLLQVVRRAKRNGTN